MPRSVEKHPGSSYNATGPREGLDWWGLCSEVEVLRGLILEPDGYG